MPATKSWIHHALLAAARGEAPADLPGPTDPRWTQLAAAATAHGVQGWVARALRGVPGVPSSFQVPLQGAALRIAANHQRLLGEAATASGLLHAGGTPAVVLKGPALVERYYRDPTLRSYGDVDLLVRPRDFAAALDTLQCEGYLLEDRNWEFLVEDLRGQVHLMSPAGAMIELHWHLVNGSRQRRTLAMGPEEIWDATEETRLGDAPAAVLRREDELAHLLLHAAMHGCDRLVWVLDIRAVIGVAPDELDWDRVVRRLNRWRFRTGGGQVLRLARAWAGAAVPPRVLDELRPGRFAAAAARAMVARWDLGKPHTGARTRQLFFATASDTLGTRVSLVADAAVPARGQDPAAPDGVFYRATIGAFHRVREKVSADGIDAVAEMVPAGDPQEGRERFVAAVAATVTDAGARRILVLSPSRSTGMSHYTHALAHALSATARVEIVDAAAGDTAGVVLSRWWRARRRERDETRVLVTSPHWSIPLLLGLTGWRGGFVWHDPILDAATPRTRRLHELYYRLLTKRLGVVVLHGSAFTRHVSELGLPAQEVLVVPHGFVPDQLVTSDEYDPAGPLVFAGRLHPYKGLGVLLAALALPGGRGLPVVVAGDGVRHELIPPSLGSVDVRPGELPDEELRGLIGSCSAMLLPYERANQSGVLATAFRSGRPVIASRVGSFEEYVDDGVNGLLVPPGDAAALAAAMRGLRDDPGLARRLAAGAARTWEEKLSPERWGAEVAAALFR
ncbi:MAG TPA: nucleotidyltransferase family protein [Actinomycetota bacterium]|nr:nucleotidyltransferase family protein [Actinomycetota bacterium]